MATQPIYLDHNATTPVDARVVAAMRPYLEAEFGNPSSAHEYGRGPREAVATARGQVAALLGAEPDEVIFTGSGSEADHLAIRGAVRARGSGHGHVVTQATEHPAVLDACRMLELEHGVCVTVLPVDADGLVSIAELQAALTPETALVTIMHANNETGTIQRIRELADIAHAAGALFHADAAQSVGKIPVDVTELHADLLTVVGHKLYAPKGVAALYVRRGVPIAPVIGGGGQERGLRAGTENVPYIVALGVACQLAAEEGVPAAERVVALRDRLQQRLEEYLPGRVLLNGPRTDRLPNTLNVSITGVRGDLLLAAAPGVGASTGSACHEDSVEPSPVLTAMGCDPARAKSAVRLSLGRTTTEAEVEAAAWRLAQAADEVPLRHVHL
jgi:cysteine desulfurase